MKHSQIPHPVLPLSEMKSRFIGIFCLLPSSAFANTAPVVSNVSVSQRADDSKLVDIYYNLADADGDACTVWVVVSLDGGATWSVPAVTFTGAVGPGQTPGTNKKIIWDAGADMPGKSGNFKVRVFADDGNGPAPMVMVGAGSFAYQNNYGSQIHLDAFMIDKYETTVQAYCNFLNADDPDGAYWDSGQEITRHGNSGAYTYSVNTDRENYPVRYVSYYDAVAFAAWRSSVEGRNYRLPTEQEWEKAAGWDPVLEKLWTYGFQQDTIGCSWCNYSNCYGAPLQVGSFDGTGGKEDAKSYYGCYDMSGNLWEWTSSIYSGSSRVIRGGYWDLNATYCAVTNRSNTPSTRSYGIGFRLVLDL